MLMSLEENIRICLLLISCSGVFSLADASYYEGDECTMKTGSPGKCSIVTQCQAVVEALMHHNMSTDDLVHCSFIGSDEVICCPILDNPSRVDSTTKIGGTIIGSNNNTTPTTPVDTSTEIDVRVSRPAVQACKRLEQYLEPGLTQHILDGIPADPGEFPHMAAIGYPQIGNETNLSFDCGGTLISERFVMTAAHCITDSRRQPVLIRLGKVAIHSTNADDIDGALDVPIKSMITHPQYITREIYNDIALIELERSVNFTDKIRPTCLHVDPEDPVKDTKLYVTGWGTINTNTRSVSGILLKAKLQISPINQCNETYIEKGLSRRNPRGVIMEQMCAFDPDVTKDACQGDSGGPLQMIIDESLKSYSVVGIISTGFNCGTTIPGLYTRVSSYLDFIESNVWPTGA